MEYITNKAYSQSVAGLWHDVGLAVLAVLLLDGAAFAPFTYNMKPFSLRSN